MKEIWRQKNSNTSQDCIANSKPLLKYVIIEELKLHKLSHNHLCRRAHHLLHIASGSRAVSDSQRQVLESLWQIITKAACLGEMTVIRYNKMFHKYTICFCNIKINPCFHPRTVWLWHHDIYIYHNTYANTYVCTSHVCIYVYFWPWLETCLSYEAFPMHF